MKSYASCMLVLLFLSAAVYAGEGGKKTFEAVVDRDGIQRVEMTGGSYYFDPDHIIVKKGIPVELTVRKAPGIAPHSIVAEEPEAGIVFRTGMKKEPAVIRFTPIKVGRYPFFCDKKLFFFKSHREHGMEGILEVIE